LKHTNKFNFKKKKNEKEISKFTCDTIIHTFLHKNEKPKINKITNKIDRRTFFTPSKSKSSESLSCGGRKVSFVID